jgi:hypothetical protein
LASIHFTDFAHVFIHSKVLSLLNNLHMGVVLY